MKTLMIALLLSSCGVDGSLINPRTGEPVQTEGRQGDGGQDGEAGTNGSNGVDGTNGSNGSDGVNGSNGVDGTSGSDGSNGSDGVDAPTTSYICTVDSSGRKDKYYITIQVAGSTDTTFEVKKCTVI